MQNNHYHTYITSANEAAYGNIPNHLLTPDVRSQREARQMKEVYDEMSRRHAEETRRQQEANAKALQQGWATSRVYTPQSPPPSTYGTPQPSARPQAQRQQPKSSPVSQPKPSYVSSAPSYSGSSDEVSAWGRVGLFFLCSALAALAAWITSSPSSLFVILFGTCALYQLFRFVLRAGRLIIEDDFDSDAVTARQRILRIFLWGSGLGLAVMMFGGNTPGSAMSKVAFYLGLCVVYQVVRFFFRVLALMNDDA